MKKLYLLSILIIMMMGNTFAQTDKPLNKKTNVHYFKNRKISTFEIWDKPQHGHAIARNKNGKEIFNGEVGYFGGSHNVEFTYYPDGAVKTIHVTMQPDGGIQHYDVTTYYSNKGIVERTEDHSIGNNGHEVLPKEIMEKPKAPAKKN